MLDVCGIETGHRPTSQAFLAKSRSMLDGCGIETHCALYGPVARTEVSRSMLDGCGIETCSDPLGFYPGGLVAIDARWLWNRDYSWRKGEPRWC